MVRKMDTDGKVSVQIGRFIKERRTELGLTQAQLAEKLHYRYGNFVGMLESGNAAFPLSRYRDYADALLVPRHEFAYLVAKDLHPELLEDLFEAFKVRQFQDSRAKEEKR
jgi:transcriptional regulator with XRE-family HTH domain